MCMTLSFSHSELSSVDRSCWGKSARLHDQFGIVSQLLKSGISGGVVFLGQLLEVIRRPTEGTPWMMTTSAANRASTPQLWPSC